MYHLRDYYQIRRRTGKDAIRHEPRAEHLISKKIGNDQETYLIKNHIPPIRTRRERTLKLFNAHRRRAR